jgi:hypothetical protein
MWTYEQSTGELRHNGQLIATGYSGFGEGKNNPTLESVPNVGPIPRGLYLIQFPPFHSEKDGPVCMHLIPERQTNTYGRSGFLIHGDSIQHTGSASHGCVIMPRPTRLGIAASQDDNLTVI